jgi:hypothetical protein
VAVCVVMVCPWPPGVAAGPFPFVALVALAAVALAVLRIPCRHGLHPRWPAVVLRTKLAALATLGLAPFVAWSLRAPDRLYLLAGAACAVAAAVWLMLELLDLAGIVFLACRHHRMATCSRLTRGVVVYLLVVPIAAVATAYVGGDLFSSDGIPRDLLRLWLRLPLTVRTVLGVPLALFLAVLWHVRTVLARQIHTQTADGRTPADPPPPPPTSTQEAGNA